MRIANNFSSVLNFAHWIHCWYAVHVSAWKWKRLFFVCFVEISLSFTNQQNDRWKESLCRDNLKNFLKTTIENYGKLFSFRYCSDTFKYMFTDLHVLPHLMSIFKKFMCDEPHTRVMSIPFSHSSAKKYYLAKKKVFEVKKSRKRKI